MEDAVTAKRVRPPHFLASTLWYPQLLYPNARGTGPVPHCPEAGGDDRTTAAPPRPPPPPPPPPPSPLPSRASLKEATDNGDDDADVAAAGDDDDDDDARSAHCREKLAGASCRLMSSTGAADAVVALAAYLR